ncbi:hypothetical protein Fcan01_04593, partial [Folsomia candida]
KILFQRKVVKMKKDGNEWKFSGWSQRSQKCSLSPCISQCQVGKFCESHAPREILLLQDIGATPPILALLNPYPTATPYTDSKIRQKLGNCGIKKTRGGKEVIGGSEIRNQSVLLYEYVVKKRTDEEETFLKIIGRWPYQNDNNKVHDSVYLAVSLMVMIKGGATLLNSRILFFTGDAVWVKSFLNGNGVTFNKGEEVENVSVNPPGVSGEINRSLPYVYLGRNDNGEFYTGVQNQITQSVSGAKSPYHVLMKAETGMDHFEDDEDMTIFQSPIPKLLRNVVSHNQRSKFSTEKEEEFSKMEIAAKKYETLVHVALKIAEIVGQTYKGAFVKGVPKQMTHFNGAIDVVDLKAVYAFMFETSLVISEVSQLEKGLDEKVVINVINVVIN